MSDSSEQAIDIYNDMQKIFAGKRTDSVYLAIGMMLGWMEMHAGRPDREGLFEILGGTMDDFKIHRYSQ